MEWTPGEIKKLVKQLGGTAIVAEIMRVKPHTIENMISGDNPPSKGTGIALLNLIKILDETLSHDELVRILMHLRMENSKTPARSRKNVTG